MSMLQYTFAISPLPSCSLTIRVLSWYRPIHLQTQIPDFILKQAITSPSYSSVRFNFHLHLKQPGLCLCQGFICWDNPLFYTLYIAAQSGITVIASVGRVKCRPCCGIWRIDTLNFPTYLPTTNQSPASLKLPYSSRHSSRVRVRLSHSQGAMAWRAEMQSLGGYCNRSKEDDRGLHIDREQHGVRLPINL